MNHVELKREMLKLVVHFSHRDDGGLRAWSDDLPGFVLSHSDANAVLQDVEPALETMLATKYGCDVKVFRLRSRDEFRTTSELKMPAVPLPDREYASQVC